MDLAVTDLPSGDVIGEVGLSRLDPVRRAALVGWWIAEGWRGRGRAVEAVRLVLDWVLSEGPLQAVMAEIDFETWRRQPSPAGPGCAGSTGLPDGSGSPSVGLCSSMLAPGLARRRPSDGAFSSGFVLASSMTYRRDLR